MTLSIECQACRLRRWARKDKADLILNANDRKVWRNLTEMFPSPYTEANADFWIAFANRPTPSIHLAIEVDGVAIGGIGIIAGKDVSCRTGQFGYWLGERHWGKGIATTVRIMVAHAFSTLPFARLEASVFEWNPSSMRVLEKAGFVREGVRKRSVFKDGQLIDSVMYAIVNDA